MNDNKVVELHKKPFEKPDRSVMLFFTADHSVADDNMRKSPMVVYEAVPVPGYGFIYVRGQVVSCSPLEALDKAAPMLLRGEIFLNSVPA